MNHFLRAFCVVASTIVTFSTAGEVLTDQDFRKVIHTAGDSIWPTISGNNKSGSQNNAFDGIRFTDDTGERWLSSFKDFGVFGDEGKEGVYAQILAPNVFLGRIYLKKYRFYLLSCGSNEAARAPKAWKVFGVPANATDSSSWMELDAQSGYTSWVKPTVETTNEFTIAEEKVTGAGFRAFRFVPLDSQARTWPSTNPDFGLMEIEFVVDVYRNVTVETDVADPFRMQGAYSPALGTAFDGVTTLTAPTYIEKDGKTYACAGHRIDDQRDGVWVTVETVEDGQNSFSYAPAEDPNAVRRVVWLWRESAIPVDLGPVDMYSLFKDRGSTLSGSAYGMNMHSSSSPGKLFDGKDGGSTAGDRWLGVGALSASSGCHTGVKQLPSTVLMPGDLFYVKNYTLYMLSNSGSEKTRAPTAWLLTAATSAGGARTTIDERTGVSWADKSTTDNALVFTPAHPEVGFSDVRFTPTASGVASPSSSTVSVGLMEMRLNVNMANPPGTLRVYVGSDVQNAGFSVTDKALLTESATVTAPEYAVGKSGARKYAVTGYRLEKFNLADTVWELVEEVPGVRTYSFAPDTTVGGYRLTWTHENVGVANPWQLTTNASSELCIRNGNWEFVVEEEEDGTLKVADNGYRAGSGELDLNAPILDGLGNEKVISIIGSRVIDGENDSTLRNLLISLVLPSNVWKIATRPFRNMTALTKLDMRCPELTYLGECAFTRDTSLKTVLFDAPKLKSFVYGYIFYNAPLSDADVSDWNLSALETLPQDAFHCDSSAGQIARGCGVLTLPALRSVGKQAFYLHTGFAELRLGTGDAQLTNIASQAFAKMAITNLVIGAKRSLTVAADACSQVNDGTGVGSLVFLADAPADRTAVDSLLAGHGSANLASLTVSKDYPAWNAYVSKTADIADADVKAAVLAVGADGAWRATDDSDYLALVWRISTGFKPAGLCIVVR